MALFRLRRKPTRSRGSWQAEQRASEVSAPRFLPLRPCRSVSTSQAQKRIKPEAPSSRVTFGITPSAKVGTLETKLEMTSIQVLQASLPRPATNAKSSVRLPAGRGKSAGHGSWRGEAAVASSSMAPAASSEPGEWD